MKSTPSCSPHRRTLVSVAVALALSQYAAALAAPVGHQVVAGQVTVTRPDVLQTVITQASLGAIVNWQSFSVGATERVDIRQPNASSVLLNRVIGNNPSEIYGRLSANGKVFLVNPNGVLFGRNAQVSVGALVASTLDIANDDFLAGRFHFAGNSTAAVDNQGQMQAAERGTVALLGGRVNNDGTISAQLGTAALVAGDKIALDFEGDGLTKIRVDQGAVAAMVANRGMIIADGGQAVLTASAAQALADTVLNQQGVVRARSLVERDGKILLDGGAHGVTLNSGTLDATGAKPLKGGTVNVLGHHVGLVGNAFIDASGDAGGGQVFVGGGVQGGDPLLRHAAATYVGGQATLRANALGTGHGGTVVLWSDGATRMFGAASATGENGGLIETSGKFLDVAGARVDAAGKGGKGGTWLLDPYNITVLGGTSTTVGISGGPDFVSTAPSSIISSQSITDVLNAGTNVSLTTGAGGTESGYIFVASSIIKSAGGDAMLTLNAADDIIIGGQVVIGSTAGRLDVDFNADRDRLGGGAISMRNSSAIRTNGGNVRFYGQNNPTGGFATGSFESSPNGILLDGATIDTTAAAGSGGGSISLRGQGTLFLGDDGNSQVVRYIGAGISTSAGALTSGSGAITLTGIGGQGGSGVNLSGTQFLTNGGGAIDIRGRGGVALIDADLGDVFGYGVVTANASFATGGGPGALSLSGESIGNNGLLLRSTIGNASMTGDITLRALNSATDTNVRPMLSTSGTLATSGTLNLLPGGVALNGDLTAAPAVTIEVDSPVPPSNAFTVNLGALGTAIQPGLQTLVIGSASHTGAIRLSQLSPLNPAFDITLQNGGAGSLGISLDAGITMPGRQLTLSSGGAVTQLGPIVADAVLLHGSQPGSGFNLVNGGNTANFLSVRFDQPRGASAGDGDIRFYTAGNLEMSALSGVGFDAVTNTRQAIVATDSDVTGDMRVVASGDLTVAQAVGTLDDNATLELVAGNDLLVPGTVEALANNTVLALNSSRDVIISGTASATGDGSSLSFSGNRDTRISGDVSVVGNDATLFVNGLNNVTVDGNIIVVGDRSHSTLVATNLLSVTGGINTVGDAASLTLRSGGDTNVAGTISMTGSGSNLDVLTQAALVVNGDLNGTGDSASWSLTSVARSDLLGDISLVGNTSLLRIVAGTELSAGGVISAVGDDAGISLRAAQTISQSGTISMVGANPAIGLDAAQDISQSGNISVVGVDALLGIGAAQAVFQSGNISMSSFSGALGISAGIDLSISGDIAANGDLSSVILNAGNNSTVAGNIVVDGVGANLVAQADVDQIISGDLSMPVAGGSLTLGAARDLTLTGEIGASSGTGVARFNAGRDILVSGARIFSNVPGAFHNLQLNSDADNVDGGAITVNAGSSITTNGSLFMFGQSQLTGGYASGSSSNNPHGILIDNATLNTSGGPLLLRGRGNTFVASGPAPVVPGDGVALNSASINADFGTIVITGIGGQGGDGVSLLSSNVASSTGGVRGIDIRGLGGAVLAGTPGSIGNGLVAANSSISITGETGRLMLSGESAGGSGVAMSDTSLRGGVSSNPAMHSSSSITLRARSTGAPAGAPTIVLDGTMATSGVVNLRPGGVSATGAFTEDPDTIINVGGAPAPGEFSLSLAALNAAIAPGTAGVVIGSDVHSGAIGLTANSALSGLYDLTLQNGGAGSGGINLYNGLSIPGRMLTLSTGGSVTQGAAIVAGRLLLHGTQPQSSFQLTNTGNAVSRVSAHFDVLKGTAPTDGDVNFYSTSNLEIGPLTGMGFGVATGQAQSIVAANAVIAGDLVAQAGGNLTLQQNVSTLGSDITLVTGGVLQNPVNATLNPGGGGRWRVFADTWVGEVDGGLTGTAPTSNYYNCLYGTGCMSLLPAANNYFVYRQQPVLTIALTTPTQTRVYGTPNPLFPFSTSGLVNGDTLAASAIGGYTIPAAVNVGSYAVTGAFSSPVGYRIDAAPGTLNVTPAMLTYVANPDSRDIGRPNPALSGAVTGLVNGDTLAGAATGTLSFTSPATVNSPAGSYAINGSGLSAQNYVFQQAPSNLTALTLKPLYSLPLPSIGHDVSQPSSELYGANFGVQRSCVGSGPLATASAGGDANDSLAMEWARVRETPNLSNCIGLVQRYSCSDF